MLIFIGVFCLIFVFYFITVNNSLVTLKNQVQKSWANIDVILKQRFDEVPQLIEIINQYLQHEKNILNQVIEARSLYGHAKSENDKIKANQQLSNAFSGIIAIGENYPDLKSNNNYVQLQKRISELEESLAHRRETYNDAVTNLNTMIEQFPSSIVASMANYRPKHLFEVSINEKSRPSLKTNV
jgi:LemA protein